MNLQEFHEIAQRAYAHHLDTDIVAEYFRAFAEFPDPYPGDVLKNLQLCYYHHPDRWTYLNKLADLLAAEGRGCLAVCCLAESLRIRPDQPGLLEKFLNLREANPRAMPGELKPSRVKVSVLMASYYRGQPVRESIESVLNQKTGHSFELIIVNDGGDDQLADIVARYPADKVRYIKHPVNRGLAAGRNTGVLNAEGEYVTYLDDDDIFYPDHIEKLVALLEKKKARFAYSSTQAMLGKYDENGVFQKSRPLFLWDRPFDRDRLAQNIYLSVCSVMHERSLIKESGLFNEHCLMTEDWDMWLRLALLTDFVHLRDATCEYRIRGNNDTIQNRLGGFFWGEIIRKYHIFHRGRLSELKARLAAGQRELARDIFTGLLGQYNDGYKNEELSAELLEISRTHLKNRKIERKAVRDYFRLDPRGCLQWMSQRREWRLLLLISPRLFLKALLGVWLRLKVLPGRVKNKSLVRILKRA